ncbi:MAG TPA: (d)CMP kinase [Chloroflexota bacterium]|nr:(d)CMP kinase [Chloroflexota bacterium]
MTSPQGTSSTNPAIRIAIDGPGGAGKSTVGRGVAQALGCPYLDTGLMYRAITALALRRGIPPWDEASLASLARATTFDLAGDVLLVNGRAAGSELRSPDVEARVSEVSAHPGVRAVLARRQREIAASTCLVMVGRDIGTVILPGAEVKLWVTAAPEIRARRRLAERGGQDEELAEVARQLAARDKLDAEKPISPMVPAPDAIVIDTGLLSPDEAVRVALHAVEDARAGSGAAPFLQR